MEDYQILWMARLAKQQSSIASMSAANHERADKGLSCAYGEAEFAKCEREIEAIVNEIEEHRRRS